MTMKKRPGGGCESCQMKNVQVQIIEPGLGHAGCKVPLRIASKHTASSLCEILSKCSAKCPSPCPSPSPKPGKCPSPSPNPGKCPSPRLRECPSPNSDFCPSPDRLPNASLDLEGYLMEKDIELLWLPLARVATLTGKSVKTIRRMVEDGAYVSLKRTVPSGKTHTTKSFIMSGQELADLDKAYCRKHRMKPILMCKEEMTILEAQRISIFVIGYTKVKEDNHAGD